MEGLSSWWSRTFKANTLNLPLPFSLFPQIFLANLFLRYKAYELSGDVGWSTVKVVPGPGLKEMKLGTQKLLFKSLQRA